MRAKYLDDKEIAALKARFSPYGWLPYAISIETGLRVGDVAQLTWHSLQGSRLDFVAQKTGKKGTAFLSEETAQLLWQLRRRATSKWMFPAPSNQAAHISRQVLWKRLKAACRDCRINPDGISPHSLRKVYAVREYREHGLSAAQAGLQHTDIGTTEIYALADWLTDENADKPLLRSDMARILHFVADWLGIPKNAPPR